MDAMTQADNVTPILRRMSKEDYDRERTRLRGLYGDSRKEAGARFEQALGRLFHLSGWTVRELAAREGRGKQHISRLLIFGRFILFLSLSPAGDKSENMEFEPNSNIPLGLTEWRFRGFWTQTEESGEGSSGGNERIRFKQVLRLMEEDAANPKVVTRRINKELGNSVVAHFADGKWHDIQVIAKRTQTPIDDVRLHLEHIRQHRSFNCSAEKKEVARTWHWRLFPLERSISTIEIAEKLAEPLKVLAEQGRANMATMSPQTVAYWTAIINTTLNEWIGKPPKK